MGRDGKRYGRQYQCDVAGQILKVEPYQDGLPHGVARHLVLDGEDVGHLPVLALGPEVMSSLRVDELTWPGLMSEKGSTAMEGALGLHPAAARGRLKQATAKLSMAMIRSRSSV